MSPSENWPAVSTKQPAILMSLKRPDIGVPSIVHPMSASTPTRSSLRRSVPFRLSLDTAILTRINTISFGNQIVINRQAQNYESNPDKGLCRRGHHRIDQKPPRNKQEHNRNDGIAPGFVRPFRVRILTSENEDRRCDKCVKDPRAENDVISQRIERP